MLKPNFQFLTAVYISLLLGACGGGGSSVAPVSPAPSDKTPATISLNGTAAVGFAVANGTVNIKCASSTSIASSTTSPTGVIQVTLSGQTLPCAIQVSGGTINSVPNSINYHSIATSAGNVNVTPLTDLLIANLAGTATPSSWFAGLTTTQLAAITSGQVTTATTNVKTALGLTTQLAGIDPITTAFTPTNDNVMDNTLEALQTAITTNGTSYASLLSGAGASVNAGFTPPAGFNAALTSAYVGPVGGGAVVPSTPNSVVATPVSASVINVTWVAVSGATGYNVYRSTTSPVAISTINKLSASPVVDTGLGDSGLTASTQYFYKVTAVNAAGESAASAEVNATTSTPATVVPVAPTGATATAVSATQINLAWATVPTATGYNVYRSTAASVAITAGNIITATPVTALTYNDSTGLVASTPYFYKVTAVNSAGESASGSNEVTATTSAASGVGTPVLLAGGGNLVGSFDNTGAAARFGTPHGIVTDSLGNAYVADGINKSIRKITPAGVVTTFAGPDYVACGGDTFLGTNCPVGDTDGAGAAARFRHPYSLAIDTAGNLYVGDQGRIRKVTPAGVVSTLAGPDAASWAASPLGNGLSGYTDGTGSAARFDSAVSGLALATDSLGNVYAADTFNDIIRKITPAGVVTTFAGSAAGYVNGTGTAARFSNPYGIATDAADNIYVVDGARIRKITPAGVVTTFAGIDVGGASLGWYVDATGTAARFNLLVDIAADASGNLYVVDGYPGSGNNLIRKITPAGVVTTVLGVLNSTNLFLAPNAQTNTVSKLAVNASSLYISQGNRIAIVNPKP